MKSCECIVRSTDWLSWIRRISRSGSSWLYNLWASDVYLSLIHIYIAIGFLPRFALLDGSAEATMLLAESIRRYRQVTGDNRYDAVLEEIDGTYRQNFVRDGHFMTNIPERLDAADYPARRNGVCEDCGDYIVPLFCRCV